MLLKIKFKISQKYLITIFYISIFISKHFPNSKINKLISNYFHNLQIKFSKNYSKYPHLN